MLQIALSASEPKDYPDSRGSWGMMEPLPSPFSQLCPATLEPRRSGGEGACTAAVVTPKSDYAGGSHLGPGSATRRALYCPNTAQHLAQSVQ